MTYREALEKGYKVVGSAWTRGYVSRKAKVDDLVCHEAGGSRKGLLYVLLPSTMSTRYCTRLYLGRE